MGANDYLSLWRSLNVGLSHDLIIHALISRLADQSAGDLSENVRSRFSKAGEHPVGDQGTSKLLRQLGVG